MSLALIQESAREVRRLGIAGSPLAVGDFRMKKLISPLEQAGAKVPVFGQVAKAISDLVNGTEAESAGRLLALSTLLNAILYTQGQTGTTASLTEIELCPTRGFSTRTTARTLKPIMEALRNAGAGRLEIVTSAWELGAFEDLRLIDPAIGALGDNYAEIADFMVEKVLPGYGPGIIPRLKLDFDLKGKKRDARKLKVLHQLDSAGTLDLCKAALEDGSVDVKEAAITCLGKYEDCLPLVLEQAGSKNKTLRAAALEALAGYERPEITRVFGELIKGKTLDVLARPFVNLRSREVLALLLQEGKRVFELLLKGEEEQIMRFADILNCLAQRKDPEVESFLIECLERGEKLTKLKAPKNSHLAGADLLTHLASLLSRIGTPKALELILAKHTMLPATAFGYVLRAALRTWPPAKFYDEFSPLLGQNKGAAKEKNAELQRTIRFSLARGMPFLDDIDEDLVEPETTKGVEWDPRWLDAAVKANEPDLVCCLARPGHKEAVSFLVKAAGGKNLFQTGYIIEALARCQYAKITDLFLELLAKRSKNPNAFHYETQILLDSARHLPPADLPRLEAHAAKLNEKLVDRFLEALEPLRSSK